MFVMGKKAIAFQVKAINVSGFELACGKCPMVLQITHDRLEPFPKHRCGESVRDFDIILDLDEIVLQPSRIDPHWKSNMEGHE